MKWNAGSLKFVLLFSVAAAFSSCGGPHKTDPAETQSATRSIGEVVSAIDDKTWVIHQDRENNYWFGSNGSGVFYYDGENLTQFTTEDGLVSDQIRGIQEDGSGGIFFDTPAGVSKFDGQKFELLEPIRSPDSQWKSEPGDLWFKGNGDLTGAYRYDGDSLYHLAFSDFGPKASNLAEDNTSVNPYGVYSIYHDERGNIWFGTLSAGVGRFDGESLGWIFEKELSVLEDGRTPGVRSIIEDKEGDFWFSNIRHRYRILPEGEAAREKGLLAYDKLKGVEPSPGQPKMVFPYYTSAVRDEENGDLWMTTYSEGVWKYDGESLTNYRIQDGQTDVLVISIYKDRQGVLWLGTDNAGVYRFNGRTFEKVEFGKT